MWWFFHFLRKYWRPFRGTTHQKSRCCAFQQLLPTKSFDRPPVTKGGTTAPCPKTHRPIRDSGKLSAREFSLRRLELQLSGECATSELSGRCVGVLTALPDPTKRQSRLSITRLCLDPGHTPLMHIAGDAIMFTFSVHVTSYSTGNVKKYVYVFWGVFCGDFMM